MSDEAQNYRSNDPDTSKEAGDRARFRAPIIREVVLHVLREKGPLTHDQVIQEYHTLVVTKPETPRASESGIRTRLSELKSSGLVRKDTDEGLSSFGNRAKRWVAVDPDDPTFGYDPDAIVSYLDIEDIVAFTSADFDAEADAQGNLSDQDDEGEPERIPA